MTAEQSAGYAPVLLGCRIISRGSTRSCYLSGRTIVARSANQTPSAASLTICVAHVAIGCEVPPLEAGLERADPQYARIGVGQPAGRKRPAPARYSTFRRYAA
ncbi:hypothetical protein ACWTU6_14460 [Mesorhizobium sp. BHbsci]